MINIYWCPIKVAIPNGWEASCTKAGPGPFYPPATSLLCPPFPTYHTLCTTDAKWHFWLQPSLKIHISGSSEEPGSAVWHLSCHLLATALVVWATLRCDFSRCRSLFRWCSYRLCLLWRWLVQNRRGLAHGWREGIPCSPEVFNTWLDRVLISKRPPLPWKAGPDDLWRSFPGSVVVAGCKFKSLCSLLGFYCSSFSSLFFFPYRLLFWKEFSTQDFNLALGDEK